MSKDSGITYQIGKRCWNTGWWLLLLGFVLSCVSGIVLAVSEETGYLGLHILFYFLIGIGGFMFTVAPILLIIGWVIPEDPAIQKEREEKQKAWKRMAAEELQRQKNEAIHWQWVQEEAIKRKQAEEEKRERALTEEWKQMSEKGRKQILTQDADRVPKAEWGRIIQTEREQIHEEMKQIKAVWKRTPNKWQWTLEELKQTALLIIYNLPTFLTIGFLLMNNVEQTPRRWTWKQMIRWKNMLEKWKRILEAKEERIIAEPEKEQKRIRKWQQVLTEAWKKQKLTLAKIWLWVKEIVAKWKR